MSTRPTRCRTDKWYAAARPAMPAPQTTTSAVSVICSIVPRRDVLTRRRRRLHRCRHLANEVRPRVRVPGMPFHRSAVGEIALVVRVLRGLEKILKLVHGEIEPIVVHVAGREVQFADDP